MLKRLSGFRFGWLQILLGLYLVLMLVSHFNYSSVQVFFPGLKELFTEGNTGNIVGQLWLDSLIPFAFLWLLFERGFPYAFILLLPTWAIFLLVTRVPKYGFAKTFGWIRWNQIFLLPPVTLWYAASVMQFVTEDRKAMFNFLESQGISFQASIGVPLCIMAYSLTNKPRAEQANPPSSLTENT